MGVTKTGPHTRETPCVSYKLAKKLKSAGFNEYTRQSYILHEFVDWMGWKNSWRMTSESGFSENSSYKKMISAPTVIQALIWLKSKQGQSIEIDCPINWEILHKKIEEELVL